MATRSTTTRKSTKAGNKALDKLGGSIDAAQQALKDLRGELSKGGRDAVKDLDVLLRDARKNLRGAQRTLLKDLEEVKAAATKRPTARTTSRMPAKRTTATKASKTASSGSARKTTARKTTAARPRSTRKS
jgi:hypothetical protein